MAVRRAKRSLAQPIVQPSRGEVAALGSSISLERSLSRFGWIGDYDDVLRRIGITRDKLRALESDDEISAALETRRDAACNTPWRFEHDTAAHAEFFNDAFKPVMHDLMRHLWQATPYGYSVAEIVYRDSQDPMSVTPGYIGIANVVLPPFEWFTVDAMGVIQWKDSLQPADPRKFVCALRDPNMRKPMGDALLSKLYWPWFFRSHGWKFWVKFLERCSIPFIVGKTNTDKDEALQALSKAVQDAVVVMGTEDDVASLNMGGARVDFDQFEQAVVRRYQRLILGQTLTSGTDGGSGNRALGQVHNEVRGEKKQSDCRMLRQAVQRVADILAALNGIDPPVFVLEDGSGLERDRAERDEILVRNRMVKFTPDYIADKYGLLPTDFEVPQEQAAPQANAALSLSDKRPPRFTAGQQILENQIDQTLGNLPQPIDPKLIASAIRAARDPQDLQDRLGVVLRDADRSEFSRVLERALFAADVMGYAHAS